MTHGAKGGRVAARIAWDVIKIYLEKQGDKSAQFQSDDLSKIGIEGYNGNGLLRLQNKSIIKVVGIKQDRKIYRVSDGVLNYSLDDILKFSYHNAVKKFN